MEKDSALSIFISNQENLKMSLENSDSGSCDQFRRHHQVLENKTIESSIACSKSANNSDHNTLTEED
jgi:hypothetical protein